jgi:hypothetical protein
LQARSAESGGAAGDAAGMMIGKLFCRTHEDGSNILLVVSIMYEDETRGRTIAATTKTERARDNAAIV